MGQDKTGNLSELYSLDIYHNRTNYEIAYRVSKLENGDMVVIIMTGTRENFNKKEHKFLKIIRQ
ncbi:MAG TPA: hypothetical protein GX004_09340 [Firmicutes bacterium]|nr:hypothetical protein [Bacillota bacterium]